MNKQLCQFILFSVCSLLIIISQSYAGPGNIATLAKVKASAELDENFKASNVNDGQIRIHKIGEWASDSKVNFWGGVNYPWIRLSWDEPQFIDKIVFYDRPTPEAHLAGGTIEFSDGSELSVNLIPNDGSACVVTFPPKKLIGSNLL